VYGKRVKILLFLPEENEFSIKLHKKEPPGDTEIGWSEVRAVRATNQASERFTYREATGN
jgi:hypothetical protein